MVAIYGKTMHQTSVSIIVHVYVYINVIIHACVLYTQLDPIHMCLAVHTSYMYMHFDDQ